MNLNNIDPTIQFVRTRDVKMPNRANLNDAGIDFYVPEYTPEFLSKLEDDNKNNGLTYQFTFDNDGRQQVDIEIPAGHQVIIPTGVHVNIKDKNTYLDAENKSGVATKQHLIVGAKVIDADYQGEIHINLHNVSDRTQVITTGKKATQFIHKIYLHSDLQEISWDEYSAIPTSDRGTGKMGSSGL